MFSGIGPFDERVEGFRDGGLYLIAGGPGSGKLTFLLQALDRGVRDGERVALVSGASPQEILDEAEKRIFEVSQGRLRSGFIHIRESADETLKLIEDLTDRQELVTGTPTGFLELDEMTSGFQDTDLVILAARPSMGKTSLGVNVCTHAALRGNKTTASDLTRRLGGTSGPSPALLDSGAGSCRAWRRAIGAMQ